MRVLVWIAPGTWPAVVAAAQQRPADDDLLLVAADDPQETLPAGALLGLMGRGRPPRPEPHGLTAQEARALLDQATDALGRPCRAQVLSGPTERVITAAAADVDRLILARDGDRSRLGPSSLGHHARFIIDHASCTVELIWPEGIPGLSTIPPPPER